VIDNSFIRENTMKIKGPGAIFKQPRFNPVLGAAILGLEKANVSITSEMITRMEKRLNQLLK